MCIFNSCKYILCILRVQARLAEATCPPHGEGEEGGWRQGWSVGALHEEWIWG